MKKIIALVFLSISLFSCTTRVENKSNLNNKIIISEETHTYDIENNKIKKDITQSKIYSGGKIISYKTEDIYEYNNDLDLTIINSYEIDDNKRELIKTTNKSQNYVEEIYFGDKSDTTKYIKDFYKNGLVVKSIKNLTFTNGELIQEIVINQYNINRKLIKKDIYDLNNNFLRSHTYTYKKKDNTIEIENRNNKGEIVENKKQQLKNDTLLYESWEIPNFSIDTVFYLNDKVIKEVSIYFSPKKEILIEYKYDKNGRIIERKEYEIIK